MKNLVNKLMIAVVLVLSNLIFAQTVATGTSKNWGSVDGISMIGLVQGPSSADTQLQVACVFEYIEDDIFKAPALPANLNGLVHLDEALKGELTNIRKSGQFLGHSLETILITSPQGAMSAKKLLLIGLGDRTQFTPELMISVGEVAAREAMRLGVSNFAFASDLKDAGIDSPTALVAGNVVRGIVQANRSDNYLKEHKLSTTKKIEKVYLLAGPSFFEIAGGGISEAIAEAHKK
ncbi:M17 family peptidase N-terminal domain-containing protein [Chryseobacterium jejuense]|uniref:Cytosol aminopeptidase family, N-terminal domain n=1 Tax=Chryseobacterium jejuense TaxID=445960 RepID=A0A2X2VAX0_CHRJE|nr:M17 family peptidase N-terminal domain-containing protein [Chryseobacterium jejuense]SDJ13881.1 Cytosol aminopeptidase family, N-terminal domain [Chryseobacterium jejuense]SQB28012.1 Cytosol aminopeptidase family, N-terminal domain [Chryseobacterium jejuense]